jgi:H+/Cl- antiporter ClcA
LKGVPLGGRFEFPVLKDALQYSDLLEAVLLGILGALVAIIFTYMVKWIKVLRGKVRLDKSPILLGLIGGALLGIAGTFVPAVRIVLVYITFNASF